MPRDPFDDEFFRRMWRMLRGVDREFKEMESEFKIDLREFERRPGVAGFKVEIRDFGKGRPEVKVRRFGEPLRKIEPIPGAPPRVERPPEAEVKPPEVKPVKRTLETNAAKVEKPDEVVLTLQAPGVKEEDVETRQLGRTLEVIARKPSGDAYFATFELPPDANPEKREIEIKDDMLVIAVPRHRPSRARA